MKKGTVDKTGRWDTGINIAATILPGGKMKRSTLNRLALTMVMMLLAVSLTAITAACSGQAETTGKIVVAVTILPQAGFVEAVGGDTVDVVVMVPPGADPHTYEVTPDRMAELSRAKMYAKVGSPVEFELVWMNKLIAVNRNMLVVDCSRGVDLIKSQDPGEPGMDPHIWLSVKNAKIMVQNICDGLVRVDPANKDYYEKNCRDYLDKLTGLDNDLAADLAGVKNRSFIVFHPAFGYFARDYNLTQIGVEQEGKEPDADYIVRLIKEAKEQDIHVVFVSPEFSTKSAESIAKAIGGKVVIIDPLAKDFINNMYSIEAAMKQAMQ
jgi:zinc transport system substrate-binding protein